MHVEAQNSLSYGHYHQNYAQLGWCNPAPHSPRHTRLTNTAHIKLPKQYDTAWTTQVLCGYFENHFSRQKHPTSLSHSTLENLYNSYMYVLANSGGWEGKRIAKLGCPVVFNAAGGLFKSLTSSSGLCSCALLRYYDLVLQFHWKY